MRTPTAILLTVLVCASYAWGFDDELCPPDPNADPNFDVAGPSHIDPALNCADFGSRCWAASVSGYYNLDYVPSWGFPLKIGLRDALGVTDLPPRTVDMVRSSSPLVSSEYAAFGGPRPFAERPMQSDLIDLITGGKLYQETDFELPFGSAVFRHIRTHGDRSGISLRAPQWTAGFYVFAVATNYNDWFWDWNGLHWMMSENPILLVDASYEGIGYSDDQQISYFIPDAHHSVPFIKDPVTDTYKAPAWFDARLTRDPNDSDLYHVYTYRGAIEYTFRRQNADLWDYQPDFSGALKNVHDPNGLGYPDYALIQRIKDRYGNTIKYYYCGYQKEECDRVVTNCKQCCENCNEKGQIRAIELLDGNGSRVWTLLYTHRAFPYASYWGMVFPGGAARRHSSLVGHMLHSIHVYRHTTANPAPNPATQPCRTISASRFLNIESFDEYDQIEANVPSGWEIEAKYLYEETAGKQYKAAPDCPPPLSDPNNLTNTVPVGERPDPDSPYDLAWQNSVVNPNGGGGMKLLKATVIREDNGSEAAQSSTVYRYFQRGPCDMDECATCGDPISQWLDPELIAVFSQSSLERIRRSVDPQRTLNVVFELANGREIDLAAEYAEPNDPPVQVIDLADVNFDYSPKDDSKREELANFLGLNLDTTIVHSDNVSEMEDRRNGERAFVFTRLREYPAEETIDPNAHVIGPYLDQPTYHWPYRYVMPPQSVGWASQTAGSKAEPAFREIKSAPSTSRFHVAVVDEYEIDQWGDPNRLISRRAVEINPAGIVLRERRWETDPNGVLQLSGVSGAGEERYYDCCGRIIEHRTKGWSVANQTGSGYDPDAEGLIYVFDYTDAAGPMGEDCNCPDDPGELEHVYVKRGLNGAPVLVQEYERHPDRPEIAIRELKYPDPSTSAVTTEEVLRYHEFEGGTADGAIQLEWVAKSSGPETRGALDRYALSMKKYDSNGSLTLEGNGLVASVDNSSGAISGKVIFHATENEYDESGRLAATTIDVSTPSDLDFARVDNDTDPLDLRTEFKYGSIGVREIKQPHDRYTIITNEWDEYSYTGETWVFKNAMPSDPENPLTSSYILHSPVELTEYSGREVTSKKLLDIPSTESYPAPVTFTEEDILSETTPEYDQSGQVRGVVHEGDGAALKAYLGYHYTGQVERQQGPDKTITRNEYDKLGRLIRVFQGTKDIHEYWQTAPPGGESDDDMVLVEKRAYGTTPSDVDALTAVREYRERPINQYFESGEPNEAPNPNNEDEIGWLTQYEYDWRQRPVCEVRYGSDNGQGAPVLGRTFTWYDNLDRVVFTAMFGQGATPTWTTTVDPRDLSSTDAIPSAAAILSGSPPPLSLVESSYNEGGLVAETRNYRILDPPDDTQYTATYQCYNHQGNPIEMRSPGSSIQRYVYDAKGRQVISKSMVGDGAGGLLEIIRTETDYDDNDRPIINTRFERWHNGAGATLSSANAVLTYTYTWYDEAGRVSATADFGTNSSSDTFENGSPPTAYDQFDSPALYEPNGLLTGCDATGLGARTLVTCYGYDNAGRQNRVIHPDGSMTETFYDGLGRVTLTIENATSASDDLKRETAYTYDEDTGQLTSISAILPGDPEALQTTQFFYDAPVIESDTWSTISSNKSWISEVWYPDPNTGEADPDRFLSFSYYSDGSVASRTDARGVTFWHWYDEQGRRVKTVVDDSAWFDDPCNPGTEPDWAPTNRVASIDYEYQDDGSLALVTAKDETGTIIISQNQFEYTDFGGLRREWQEQFGLVDVDTLRVDYLWDYSSAAGGRNFARLTAMRYPERANQGGTRRRVNFEYGDPNSPDDKLNRVSELVEQTKGSLVAYQYAGTSRRVTRELGNGVTQSFVAGSATGYAGLDQHGRVKDLDYQRSSSTVHRYQYEYDLAGNRLFARTTQANDGSSNHVNDRSYLYEYDELNRLVWAGYGELNGNNDALSDASRTFDWALDNLGNWSAGGGNTPPDSFVEQFDRNDNDSFEPNEVVKTHHKTDLSNEIDRQVVNGASTRFIHDIVGNLVFDGERFYQYDGWNRLMQVNAAGSLTATDFDAAGHIATATEPGDVVVRFVYDGLGRCIRKIVPDPYYEGQNYRENYYYDGVRRIFMLNRTPFTWDPPLIAPEESLGLLVFVDPNAPEPNTPSESDPNDAGSESEEAESPDPNTPLDPNDPNAPGGPELLDAGGGGSAMLLAGAPYDEEDYVWVYREWVWSPDYVDELVATFDEDQDPYFALVDGNFNVMAILHKYGDVIEQYAYSPYGRVVARDNVIVGTNGVAFNNRVGHQGLFFDRFGFKPGETPALDPNATGLYYNRNRSYSPHLGRFLQKDVNETALPIITAMVFNAGWLDSFVGPFGAVSLYGDGMSLYAYLGSNPINWGDPSGLSVTDDAIDALIWELTGERVAALHHAFGTFERTAQIAATAVIKSTIAAIFPPYGLQLAIEGAAAAIESIEHDGPNPLNLGMLGLSLLGVRADYQATMMMMGRATACISRGYSNVGARYAEMGMGRSAFSPLKQGTRYANKGRLFEAAGIKTSAHFRDQLASRASRLREEDALDAYLYGRLFYDPATRRYIRHSTTTRVSVVTTRPSGGTAWTVFEGQPSSRWIPVRWRPGV